MEKKRKLTIKYFIEQKIIEISKALGILIVLVVTPYIIGKYSAIIIGKYSAIKIINIENLPNASLNYLLTWCIGAEVILGIAILTLFGFLMVRGLGRWIICWIEDNWERAEERAGKEVKKR